MLSQIQTHLLHPFNRNKFSTARKLHATVLTASWAPFSTRIRSSTAPLTSNQKMHTSPPPANSLVATAPPIVAAKNLGLRPTLELGLMSHLFVLTLAFVAFFSVIVVSIPTLIAFGRLGDSVKKLSQVVSDEVPGTLSSLKLSGMELNDLTQQLGTLRHKISGVSTGKKEGRTTDSRYRKKNPAS